MVGCEGKMPAEGFLPVQLEVSWEFYRTLVLNFWLYCFLKLNTDPLPLISSCRLYQTYIHTYIHTYVIILLIAILYTTPEKQCTVYIQSAPAIART